MSDLREQLAYRMQKAFWHESDIGDNPAHVKCWLPVADECIRQMRWVAFQTAHSYRSSEGFDDKDDALKDSAGYVTAAPDDWRAPE